MTRQPSLGQLRVGILCFHYHCVFALIPACSWSLASRNVNWLPTMNPLKSAIIVNNGRDSPSQVNYVAIEADSEKKAKSAVVFACFVAVETLYVSKRTGKNVPKYVANYFFHSNIVSVPCRCPCQQIYGTLSCRLTHTRWSCSAMGERCAIGLSKIKRAS